MPISVSTDMVRPSERQAFWTDAICRSFANVDTRPLCPGEISGHFEVREIGSAKISRFDTSPQSYSRDARLVSSAGSDDFMFDFQLAGRSCVIQGAHEGRVRPGYGVLYDARRPFEDFLDRSSGHDAEVLMVTVPARPLLEALPEAERLCAVPFALSGAVGCATTWHLHSMVLEPAGRPRQRGPAEDDIIAYLAALLRLATGGTLALSRGRLFGLLDAHVRQSLGEPQSPEGLAMLFGISGRTLHRTFADEHTTLERHLLRLRAERLRELLSQPRWSKVPIGKLAIECGFADAAHASRAFRTNFDETPRDCRSRALCRREGKS
jgi:AraC-like DNA-binding protein